MEWMWREFEVLSNRELYEILELREQVFTIGQKCTEPDMDGVDLDALHLLGYEAKMLVAYLRCYEKDGSLRLGRILVAPDHQGKGLGRMMMQETLSHLREHQPNMLIEMSAQKYLEDFYASLGFVTEGEPYQEAGIEHVFMLLDQSELDAL